jgi:hypothetical protein
VKKRSPEYKARKKERDAPKRKVRNPEYWQRKRERDRVRKSKERLVLQAVRILKALLKEVP